MPVVVRATQVLSTTLGSAGLYAHACQFVTLSCFFRWYVIREDETRNAGCHFTEI